MIFPSGNLDCLIPLRRATLKEHPTFATPSAGAPFSEGGMIRLETLIELKLLNSSFSLIEIRQAVPCRAIRGNGISVSSTLPPFLLFRHSRNASPGPRRSRTSHRPRVRGGRTGRSCAWRTGRSRGRRPRGSVTFYTERGADYGRKPHRDCLPPKNLSWASIYWYMREQLRGTVSSNTTFQTVPFQQYSANLSYTFAPSLSARVVNEWR